MAPRGIEDAETEPELIPESEPKALEDDKVILGDEVQYKM